MDTVCLGTVFKIISQSQKSIAEQNEKTIEQVKKSLVERVKTVHE